MHITAMSINKEAKKVEGTEELVELVLNKETGHDLELNKALRAFVVNQSEEMEEGLYKIKAVRPFVVDTTEGTITLKTAVSNTYEIVCMTFNIGEISISIRAYVHEIVAVLGFGVYEDDLVVNHMDNNNRNNRLDNLELITQSENRIHGYVVKTIANELGLSEGRPVLKKSMAYKDIPERFRVTGRKNENYKVELVQWYLGFIR